jgi:hypothetical protein
MAMRTLSGPRARLSVEPLEPRTVPAGNVATVISGNTLFLIGDVSDDSIILSQPLGPGTLTITPTGGTTVNRQLLPVSGVLPPNLTIELGAGNDSVAFDLGTRPILIQNALTINYGIGGVGTKVTQTTGATANFLTVGGNFGIRYAAGATTTTLDNLAVLGGLTVLHGVGDSTFTLDNKAGSNTFSSVGGNLFLANTQGAATNSVLDTNVRGSVTISNGRARPTDNAAGTTTIAEANNTTLATIGGNLVITNASGDSTTGDTVGDVVVQGSVGLFLGNGTFGATVAAQHAASGPTIDGFLTVRAAANGSATVHLGAPGTGLTVKHALTVRSGDRPATVTLDDVSVTGATGIFTGQGADTISIDGRAGDKGSTFGGVFTMTTGPATDTLNIGTGSTGATTTYRSTVNVSLGAGDDALNLATVGKVAFANFSPVFDGGLGTNTKDVNASNLLGKTPIVRNFA